jgi:hypothetical protein
VQEQFKKLIDDGFKVTPQENLSTLHLCRCEAMFDVGVQRYFPFGKKVMSTHLQLG